MIPTARLLVVLLMAAAGSRAAGSPLPAAGAANGPISASKQVAGLPTTAQQGSLIRGKVVPGSRVEYAGRVLRVSPDGSVVFGIGRDATGTAQVRITPPGQSVGVHAIGITARDWPVQHVNGVPPKTVDPPPAIAARIAREQAAVNAARQRDDARTDFTQSFIWPVQGRISGRFGHGRVYNGKPGAGHSGMDIAAATGTPVKAPTGGVVTFADPGLYLTGGTVVLDHGHGVSSNFLHLSRIDVRVGDVIAQGQVLGAVGATGRATGPHLHWGLNWFDVRVDPLLVLDNP